MLGCLPNSDKIKNIDSLLYLWMYFSWQKDQEEKHKFAEDYSMLTGAFYNPEMYKRLKGVGGTSFKSTNFEELSEKIRDIPSPINRHPRRRRRRMKE